MANTRKERYPEDGAKGRRETVAAYFRVSTEMQAERETIERQRYVCSPVVARLVAAGASFVGEYADNGYNLESFDSTRQIWKLLRLIEKSLVTTIVIASDDRIFRGESQRLRGKLLDALRVASVRVVTPTSDTVYRQSDAGSRLISAVAQEMGSAAKLEMSRTLASGHRRQVEERNYNQPIAPFAIRVERSIVAKKKTFSYRLDEGEAEIVRDIYSLYLGKPTIRLPSYAPKKLGYHAIAKVLQIAGIKRETWIAEAAKGASPLWTGAAVHKILSCELYTGTRTITFKTTKVLPEKILAKEHPEVCIVSMETFNEVQTLRRKKADDLDRSDNQAVRTADIWFHEFLRCTHCGQRLTVRHNYQRRASYYGCKKSCSMPRLELLTSLVDTLIGEVALNGNLRRQISEAVISRYESNKATSRTAKPVDKVDAIAETKDIRRRIDHVTERYALGEDGITDDEYAKIVTPLKEKLTELLSGIAIGNSLKKGLPALTGDVALLNPKHYIDLAIERAQSDGTLLRLIFKKANLQIRVSHPERKNPKSYIIGLFEHKIGNDLRWGETTLMDALSVSSPERTAVQLPAPRDGGEHGQQP